MFKKKFQQKMQLTFNGLALNAITEPNPKQHTKFDKCKKKEPEIEVGREIGYYVGEPNTLYICRGILFVGPATW